MLLEVAAAVDILVTEETGAKVAPEQNLLPVMGLLAVATVPAVAVAVEVLVVQAVAVQGY
jgi:hypothetical protein